MLVKSFPASLNHADWARMLYARFALEKRHYLSSGTHTVQLTPWDANGAGLTITNHECPSIWSLCAITGPRYEADTYVFALQGPHDKVVAGTYTVDVVANIPHDKDFNDNVVSYVYDASATTDQGGDTGGGDTGAGDQTIGVADLPIIDLPGPGTYPATIDPALPGMLYRLAKECPGKRFYAITKLSVCPFMKLITLEKLLKALRDEGPVVTVDPEIRAKALQAVQRMVEVSA